MKKAKRYFVSPAHFINTVLIYNIILVCGGGIILFAFLWGNLFSFVMLGLCWLIFFISISIGAFISRRGSIVVCLKENSVESCLIQKKKCDLKDEEICYIGFYKSYNYGNDTKPIYVVLSNQRFSNKKNIAVSYDINHEIVIRVTEKNFEEIRAFLKRLKLDYFDDFSFHYLQSRVMQDNLKFFKQANMWRLYT